MFIETKSILWESDIKMVCGIQGPKIYIYRYHCTLLNLLQTNISMHILLTGA